MKRRQNIRASHTDTRAGQRRRVASRRTASSVPGRSTKPSGILIITSHKPVSGQSINVDSSVATRAFLGTNHDCGNRVCLCGRAQPLQWLRIRRVVALAPFGSNHVVVENNGCRGETIGNPNLSPEHFLPYTNTLFRSYHNELRSGPATLEVRSKSLFPQAESRSSETRRRSSSAAFTRPA